MNLELPDPANPAVSMSRGKYVVALQGGVEFERQRDVAVAIASTNKNGRLARDFEVVVDVQEGFAHSTVIDGRWIRTMPQVVFSAGDYLTTLNSEVMDLVSEAIVVGLQL